MQNKVVFELGHKPKFFIPELIARIVLTTFICITYTNFNQRDNLVLECLSFCILMNVVISFISLYYGYRRVLAIKKTFISRLSNQPTFINSKFEFESDFKYSDFRYLVVLQAFIFGIAVFLEPIILSKGKSDQSTDTILVISSFIVMPICYILVFLKFKGCFMNHNIISIKKNDQKLSDSELASTIGMFEEKPISSTHYLNDMWLISYRRKLSEYRQRVDTLLIEAVFIGTLTFATFVQLTSPESISSLPMIQKTEEDYHDVHRINDTALSKSEFLDILSTYEGFPKTDTLYRIVDSYFPSTGQVNINPNRSSLGYFQNWVINRKLTIFKTYYLGRNDKKWIFQHITDKNVTEELSDIKAKTLERIIKTWESKNVIHLTAADYKNISKELMFWKLAREIDSIPMESLKVKKNREIEILSARYSTIGWERYKSIIKSTWDEQEFLFLIAIGSIMCSVCFIAVLLKRFPIIVGIENFASEINKATVWNTREEHIQLKKIEFDIESKLVDAASNEVVVGKYEERRDAYTERLQSQLAICELQANRLETNIKTVSILRTFGLFIFYFVLSISTLMIDYVVSVFLFVILTYSIFGAQIMNDESIFYWVFSKIFKRKAQDNTIFAS
jgi:5S rRNA maturation endonuclease (ribonuclease M5)